jgi:hypothetical protein
MRDARDNSRMPDLRQDQCRCIVSSARKTAGVSSQAEAVYMPSLTVLLAK